MLTMRSIPLFIHLLGVIALFIAIVTTQRAGARARAARTTDELRVWLSLARTTAPMFPVAFLLILGGGLYMTYRTWTFSTPWVVVGLVSVGIMLLLGGLVVGRSVVALDRAAEAAPPGPVTPELGRMLRRPSLWTTMGFLTGIGVGMLWVMINKPDWLQSITVVVTLSIVAAVAGLLSSRR